MCIENVDIISKVVIKTHLGIFHFINNSVIAHNQNNTKIL